MVLSNPVDRELVRARVVLLVMIAALVFLAVFLWRVQVLNASEYRSSLERQSMRRVRLPGRRGVILDRNGVCMADNKPSYCIAIYVEELKQPGRWKNTVDEVERVTVDLAKILKLERRNTREDIRRHIRRRLPLPFLVWKNIDRGTLARWAESNVTFPGVDVYVEPIRTYPHGSLAAHLLGYVGRLAPEQDLEKPYDFYIPEMEGKNGVEQTFNDVLAGLAGGRLIRVDASGFRHKDEKGGREPWSGDSIILAIDYRIQRIAEGLLAGEKGAVVVIDPRNGDVLAMASCPSFDPNSFSPGMSETEFDRLKADKGKPFFNRAISGCYPPGSTFKLMVAIAALENGRAKGNTVFNCPGYFQLGGTRFRCWRGSGHGRMGMRRALKQSCNAYFCQLGLKSGYQCIYHMADAVGFGRTTGIALEFESAGLLPDNAWKVRVHGDAWRSGDTCNLSIGQGALSVTAVQMAVFTAAIANEGYVYRPRIVLNRKDEAGRKEQVTKGEIANRMGWSPETMRVVRGGMHDVIHADTGTGKRAKVPGVEMAGKTGTAEYGPRSERKKYAWMIVFAPFKDPRYAAVVVIEDALSAGVTAAPRIKHLMQGIFMLEGGNKGIEL